jgi:glycosyltransferase involved in cell wall biosynthesis
MNLGGAENFIMNIYRTIDRTEIQFDFLVNAPGEFDEEIVQMGGKMWMIPYVNPVGPIRYRAELKKFFLEHSEYHVIHSHLDKVSGEVIQCAKEAGVKRCITHSHSTSTTGNILIQLLKNYYQKKIPRYADVKFACSKQAGEWLYGDDSAIVINNAIDINKFRYQYDVGMRIRKTYGIAESAFVIGHIGLFRKVKNHSFLIEIFESYHKMNSNAFLLLCGDGSEKKNIRRLIQEKQLDECVLILDACEDVYQVYNAMDIFVFPSIFEGMSLAMLEAQANGLPIVASDTIDKKIALTENVSFVGLDVSPEKWLEAIEKARALGRRDGSEKLRKAGFDISAVAEQLVRYYEEV